MTESSLVGETHASDLQDLDVDMEAAPTEFEFARHSDMECELESSLVSMYTLWSILRLWDCACEVPALAFDANDDESDLETPMEEIPLSQEALVLKTIELKFCWNVL